LPLLLLKLRPDDIGVGSFARLLPLPGKVRKLGCLIRGTLRDQQLPLTREAVVEEPYDSGD